MKKIDKLKIGLVVLLAPLISFSQQINEIKTDGLAFNEGSSVKFEISFNGQGRCGLQFNFGDGSTSVFRVEDTSEPIVAIKSYPAKGTYKIEATGRTLIRGLNSLTPCKGNAKIEISVGNTEQTTVVTQTAPQNNQSTLPKQVETSVTSSPQSQNQQTSDDKFTYQGMCKGNRKLNQREDSNYPCDTTWTYKELNTEILKLNDYANKKTPKDWESGSYTDPYTASLFAKRRVESVANTASSTRAKGIALNYQGLSAQSAAEALKYYKQAAEIKDSMGIINAINTQYRIDSYGIKNPEKFAISALDLLEKHIQIIDSIEPDKERAERNRKLSQDHINNYKQIIAKIDKEKSDLDSKRNEEKRIALSKGAEFAKEAGESWKLFQKKDELSGKTVQFARFISKVDQSGSEATTDLTCNDGIINFEITAKNLVIPARYSKGQWYVDGRQASNEKVSEVVYTRSEKFNNVIQGSIAFETSQGFFTRTSNGGVDAYLTALAQLSNNTEGPIIYRLLFEIPTSKGSIIVKLPPTANAIRALTKNCK